MIVSVFDCDGTLFSAHFGRGMIEYSRLQGSNGRVRGLYLKLLIPYILRKLRLIDAESLNRPIIDGLGGLIKGFDLREGAAAFDWVAHEYLLTTIRPEVVSRLKDHQAQGHRVILLTGIFSPCLALIGAHFGVTDLVGTGVEMVDGHYSGEIVPPVVTGRDKLPSLLKYCDARNLDIDWGLSYAYADSIYDRGVLELVGHPAAVYPDEELSAMAQEKGWEVIGGD